MTYEIIATGSSGNAVVINDLIMIDCGVPFKELEHVRKKLKLVLLTHAHSDHFNRSTVKELARLRPTLHWGCCEWMARPLIQAGVDPRKIDVYTPGVICAYGYLSCFIEAETLTHNVPNCGYHIRMGGEKLFYATDTGTLDGISAPDYDLYLIEANHTRADIEQRISEKRAAGQFSYEYVAARNHLSKEQAEAWLYSQCGPNSKYQFLHQHKEKEEQNAE